MHSNVMGEIRLRRLPEKWSQYRWNVLVHPLPRPLEELPMACVVKHEYVRPQKVDNEGKMRGCPPPTKRSGHEERNARRHDRHAQDRHQAQKRRVAHVVNPTRRQAIEQGPTLSRGVRGIAKNQAHRAMVVQPVSASCRCGKAFLTCAHLAGPLRTVAMLPKEILAKAATIARGLAIDAVHASQSGHLGLPLGCAEIGAVLYGHALRHCPDHPEWLNRDRFVLSAGHGSMFLYAWLHLSGYADMPVDEIKRFRQLHSRTPGHPELTHAPSGVETTTGPLGQGVANAVGMAMAAKMAEARFNTPAHTIFDHRIICLAGDGCMQEGVAMEAVAVAGHQKLGNLILIYHSDAVTLDAMAKETPSEDTGARFEAIGFDVQTVDGHDMEMFLTALERARAAGSGKPQFIIAKTR